MKKLNKNKINKQSNLSKIIFQNNFHQFKFNKIFLYKKFCNLLVFNGKRHLAYKIFFQTLFLLKQIFNNISIFFIISSVVQRLRIPLELKPWIKSGIRYKLPSKISFNRINLLAVKLLVTTAKERSERSFALRLTNEIVETYLNKSNSIKNRQTLISECLNCRPFLSFKRFGQKKKKFRKIH
jgi:small subunit ribosomal protein S7